MSLNIELLKVVRPGTVSNSYGVQTEATPVVYTAKGNVQPLDYLTAGGVTRKLESLGVRDVEAVKVYSSFKFQDGDIVTRVKHNTTYKVLKYYNYNEYGLVTDHYKIVMYLIED